MVLPARTPAVRDVVRATRRNDKYTRCHGDPATALSPVCAAFVRFRQLQRHHRQDNRREIGHLRDLDADSQANTADVSIEDPRNPRLDENRRTEFDVDDRPRGNDRSRHPRQNYRQVHAEHAADCP